MVGFLWSNVKNVRLKVAQPEADWLYHNLSMKADYHVTSDVLMNKSGFANLIIYIGKLDETSVQFQVCLRSITRPIISQMNPAITIKWFKTDFALAMFMSSWQNFL